MIAYLYSNTKPFEAEMSRENSLKTLSFATTNDAIFEMFLHLRASLVVTSRWPESSGWPSWRVHHSLLDQGLARRKKLEFFSDRKFHFVNGKYCSVPYYAYTFRSLKVNRIGFSVLWFENKKPSYDSHLEKNIPAQASTQAAQASRH